MRSLLQLLLIGTLIAITPVAIADNDAAPTMVPAHKIPKEIVELASDPLAAPGGTLPPPIRQPKMQESPRSTIFYALPMIGFWLILRRRGRGIRL